MNKITGIPDGKILAEYAKQTFNTDNPTAEQTQYVLTALVPSLYALTHHQAKGHDLTFTIDNRDMSNAISHRP